jgi:NNP family nitrate/nitrite transporter-like MFS transporter
MGGLGGFFPPLVLGVIKTNTGSYALGFILLSAFCFLCLLLNYIVLIKPTRGAASGLPAQSPA